MRAIEDYALIGDCETAALVARDGSIDWLCWPRFDSRACFAALLGGPEQGRWLIAPAAPVCRTRRRYLEDTLVLETEFETADGTAAVLDFMPPRHKNSDVVRIVEGRRGSVAMVCELALRFDYGSVVPWVRREDAGTLKAIAGPDMTVLRTPVALEGRDLKTHAAFTVAAGQRVPFVLTYGASHRPLPDPVDAEQALADTVAFWRDWTARGTAADGRWAGPIKRSLITLKALTYQPTGGIVAAPTTSLPEALGGARNWDYRFCWLRDSTFTLLAMMNAGYFEEAGAWRDWLLRAVAGSPSQMQIMYGIDGARRHFEVEVPWLPGFAGSKPVRVGNAAAEQFQLDVYGEVMDTLHMARHHELGSTDTAWDFQTKLMEHLETVWRQPDEGIWEVRNGRRQFTYSKVMAWVAFDRAASAVERFGLDGPAARWRGLANEIHAEVCRGGFNAALGAFTQFYGADHLDASLLLMPLVGFLPSDDPRIRGTVAAIERHLTSDGFVLRYDTERNPDGLPAGEGVFLACSFWLADNYVLQGRIADAERLFERLLGLANDVGLLAEEYDPKARCFLGNFPQAFSHIALVNTAYNLGREQKPAERRAAS